MNILSEWNKTGNECRGLVLQSANNGMNKILDMVRNATTNGLSCGCNNKKSIVFFIFK